MFTVEPVRIVSPASTGSTTAKVCCAFLMTKGKIVLFLFLIFFSCFLSCFCNNDEYCTISPIFSFGPAASKGKVTLGLA